MPARGKCHQHGVPRSARRVALHAAHHKPNIQPVNVVRRERTQAHGQRANAAHRIRGGETRNAWSHGRQRARQRT